MWEMYKILHDMIRLNPTWMNKYSDFFFALRYRKLKPSIGSFFLVQSNLVIHSKLLVSAKLFPYAQQGSLSKSRGIK